MKVVKDRSGDGALHGASQLRRTEIRRDRERMDEEALIFAHGSVSLCLHPNSDV